MRLSPRQTDIVTLVARDGMTYDEVAEELGIHISTVRAHIAKVCQRHDGGGRPLATLHRVYHVFVAPSS